ncbi:MAG: hypothetical protein ACLPQS_08750 [Acidimicrobiales bacterium]
MPHLHPAPASLRFGLAAGLGALALGVGAGVWTPVASGAARPRAAAFTAATNGSFNGVSCTSSKSCEAVGTSYDAALAMVPLAERWDGTSWTIQPTADPGSSSTGVWDAVSCYSSDDCVAVGSVNKSATQSGLIEKWDGTKWAIQPSPDPSGGGAVSLNGVSCPSATSCTAVGQSHAGSVNSTLAEEWNGSSWKIKTSPDPSGEAYGSTLTSVSCTSANACAAVGHSEGKSGQSLLAESWGGTKWVIDKTASPPGKPFSGLWGVSCTGPKTCTSVGDYYKGSDGYTLAEGWKGGDWTIETTVNSPAAKDGNVLNAVACVTKGCMAVGLEATSVERDAPLAESWNGSKWSLVTAAGLEDINLASLVGVSCTATSSCVAVGSYENSSFTSFTLAESWNGTKWTIHSTPDPKVTSA